MFKRLFIITGLAAISLLSCGRALTPAVTDLPAAPTAHGDALQVTVRQLVDHTEDYVDRTVIITGEIVVECSQGCWFFLDDGTGMIYVDLKPAGLSIAQMIGEQATVRGKIQGSGGNLQILGEEVLFP